MLPPEHCARCATTTTKNYLMISNVGRHCFFDPRSGLSAAPIPELPPCIESDWLRRKARCRAIRFDRGHSDPEQHAREHGASGHDGANKQWCACLQLACRHLMAIPSSEELALKLSNLCFGN